MYTYPQNLYTQHFPHTDGVGFLVAGEWLREEAECIENNGLADEWLCGGCRHVFTSRTQHEMNKRINRWPKRHCK